MATSLVAIVPIGLLGSIQNHRHKNVNFRAGGLIGMHRIGNTVAQHRA